MTGVTTEPERGRLSTAGRAIVRRFDSGPVLTIASGAGMASLAMNFWVPFLPLYMRELGAPNNTSALFWVGVATTAQGLARLASGPLWGMLSDRMGRKVMYVRALYLASVTTLIACLATEPWHVAIAFACQGLFSGFIPAAVALTSVTVPESQLGRSLGTVTAAQYLGNTIGPAIGALLAIVLGMRGAILASALLPSIGATMVLFVVPRDKVAPAAKPSEAAPAATSSGSVRRLLTAQFGIAILIYFVLFATGQLLRLTAPVAIDDLTGSEATGLVGAAFTIAGIASVIGVVLARNLARPGRFVRLIAVGMAATAAVSLVLAWAPNAVIYVGVFALISLLQAMLLPASNTLIASNAPRERRGTAFGIASSAQALAFMVGPMSAALFAAISLSFGYVVLGILFAAVAAFALFALREPPALEPSAK
jgi:DHA1 family multidrug resistance protein-like MFS transporter